MIRAGLVECEKCFLGRSCPDVVTELYNGYGHKKVQDCPLCVILMKEGFVFRFKEGWEK